MEDLRRENTRSKQRSEREIDDLKRDHAKDLEDLGR
jgi:hypothetical protein